MSRARVGVLGYGVIGRRVAEAARLQDDMELVGVAGPSASHSLRDARLSGLPVYVCDEAKPGEAAARFGPVEGTFAELARRCDVILDCTPGGVPSKYLATYDQLPDLTVIVQGGEK